VGRQHHSLGRNSWHNLRRLLLLLQLLLLLLLLVLLCQRW
jgi:hypothetical protein